MAEYINQVATYVVSSTLDKADWHNTSILRGNLVEEVTALKLQNGKDIVVTGSGELVWSLMREGLVDEYRLLITPTVRGHGKRFSPDGIYDQKLQLLETRAFDSGVVLIRYRPTRETE